MSEALLLREDFLPKLLNPSPGGHTDDSRRYIDSEPRRVGNGVTVVDVDGVLAERADPLEAIDYRRLSTKALTAKIELLGKDRDTGTVVFSFSSPGGEVGGIQACARAIADLVSVYGKKTVAYVDSQACSGAYWLAAACSRIVLSSDTSEVGSVGVVIAHREMSGLEAKIGVKTTEVASGQDKRVYSAYEPLSEAGRKALYDRASEIHAIFASEVSRYRPSLSLENRDMWASGKVFLAGPAVAMGLADEIAHVSDFSKFGEQSMDLEKLKTEFPGVYAEAVKAGVSEGISQERARVVAVMGITIQGYEGAKSKAISEGVSAEALAMDIVQGRAAMDQVMVKKGVEQGYKEPLVALYEEAPRTRVGFESPESADMKASIEAAVAAANKL